MNLPAWISLRQGVPHLLVKAQPGAKRSEISGEHDGHLKIKIAAAPVDGAANRELLEFLAKLLGVRAGCLTVISGETSKTKTVAIEGLAIEHLLTRLIKYLDRHGANC